jgi:hypothetical protein
MCKGHKHPDTIDVPRWNTGENSMTRTQYRAYRRSIRDNGLAYTLRHAPKPDGYTLARLDIIAGMQDMLAWRVRWINQPDTTRGNIIRLTSTIA